MRCRRVERRLSDHLEGLLAPADEGALMAHLAVCPACRRRREELRAVAAELRALAALPAPAGTEYRAIDRWLVERDEVWARQPLRSAAPARSRRMVFAAALTGAAAVAVLLAMRTGLHQPPRREVASSRRISGATAPPVAGRKRPACPPKRLVHGPGDAGPSRITSRLQAGFKPDRLPIYWGTSRRSPPPGFSDNVHPLVRDDFVTIPLPRIAASGPAADRAAAEAAAAYQRDVAVIDTRLARLVTLAFNGTALADLCDRLRTDTGIQLAAGSSVADEKVTLFCEQQPLRDVMRQLSRPFGYTWLRSGKPAEYRYELVQDLRSQLLEEELRNRDRNAALLALDREMQQYRKYLSLSPDEALARARTADPEEKKLLERVATGGWGLIQMYFRLSPNDMAALRAGRRLIFRQEPKAGQQLLPADLVRGVMQSQRDRRIVSRADGFHLGNIKENPDGLFPTAVPEVRAEVMIRMPQSELGQFTLTGGPGLYIADDRGFDLTGSAGDLAVGVSPTVLNPDNAAANARLARDPSLRPRVTVRPQPSCGTDLSPGPSPKRGGVTVSRSGIPSPETAKRDDIGGAEQKLPLPASGDRSRRREATPGAGGEVSPARVTTADVLEALHRATGLPMVADHYTRLYPLGEVSVQNVTLFDALNRLADAMRLRWVKEGSWLQFRSTSYFNDRLKEVPNRLLARWSASRRQHGALTVDDLIEIAQLSDAQLDATAMAEGAQECWGLAEWELVSRHHYLRPHLRYLAGFNPEQRRFAMTPEGLPFTRMTLAQQQQFLAFLLLPEVDRISSAEDLAGATLRVGYTLPGEFCWVLPGWRRYLPLIIRERTPEAALQAARQTDPRATEAQLAPTRLDLAFVYTRASSPRFRAVCRDADGWTNGQ